MFEMSYIKDNSCADFSEPLNVTNIQNYNPIYNLFFKLNESNYNNIQLNEQFKLQQIKNRVNHNCFSCELQTSDTSIITNKDMFIKFSPIIDPTKYLIGKYNTENDELFSLPSITESNDIISNKKNAYNNSAYTDGFFSFLSSKLLHKHDVLNANDYYGSFIANQKDFRYNVFDDIEYLCESDFFHDNKDVLFTLDEAFYDEADNNDSRNNKKKIQINNNNNISLKSVEAFSDEIYDNIFTSCSTESECINNDDNSKLDEKLVEDISPTEHSLSSINLNKLSNSRGSCKTCSSHSSSCSSRTSVTDNNDNESMSGSDIESLNDMSSCESDESEEDENIYAYIPDFPVNIIALEKCTDTLDAYMMDDDVSDKEWSALLMQVIFTLLIYQKTFSFTHNDLHTNNIMYIETDRQFMYYNFSGKFYKVPTFGKIWKIIDFGRAIYKYNNQVICSDCFGKNGDADGQYNCEPFFNDSKPRLETNMSFDLCRLGCSLFDFFVDDIVSMKRGKLSPIERIIIDWCYDDNNKNILYKKSGEERYPEFKLYKMIARNVHKHTPEQQLEHDVFIEFQVTKKKLNSSALKKIMYIDNLPNYSL